MAVSDSSTKRGGVVPHAREGACLLVVPAVQVAQLPDQARVNQAVCSNQVVRHRRLAMVNMCQDANVPYSLLQDRVASGLPIPQTAQGKMHAVSSANRC